jgi:hypothetical protein
VSQKFDERDAIRLDYTDTDGEKGCRYRGMMPSDGGDEQKAADQLVLFTVTSPYHQGVRITRVSRVLMGDGGPWNDKIIRRLKLRMPAAAAGGAADGGGAE